MWETYGSAKRWHKRPSEILGIEDEYTAYCFDEACTLWGVTIEYEMENVGNAKDSEALRRGKALNVLRKFLGLPQQFRDPATSSRAQLVRPEPNFPME